MVREDMNMDDRLLQTLTKMSLEELTAERQLTKDMYEKYGSGKMVDAEVVGKYREKLAMLDELILRKHNEP